MYFFGNFGRSEHSKNRNFIPKLEKQTFYGVKCVFFGILDLQNIAKIGKNLQKLAKSYILQCKIAFFDFQGGCQKHM